MVVQPQLPFLYRGVSTVDEVFKYLNIVHLHKILSNRALTFMQVTGLDCTVE